MCGVLGVTREEVRATDDLDTYIDEDAGYIWIGDSRTVGADKYVGISDLPNTWVVAKSAMGYEYMVKKAYPKALKIKRNHPEIETWYLITNFGVNDISNVDKYEKFYENISGKFTLVMVSVNPVGKKYTKYKGLSYKTMNKKIKAFNKRMKALSDIYVDTFSLVKRLVKEDPDKYYYDVKGLHYSPKLYRRIVRKTLKTIEGWD